MISDPTFEEEQLAAGLTSITMEGTSVTHMYKPGNISYVLVFDINITYPWYYRRMYFRWETGKKTYPAIRIENKGGYAIDRKGLFITYCWTMKLFVIPCLVLKIIQFQISVAIQSFLTISIFHLKIRYTINKNWSFNDTNSELYHNIQNIKSELGYFQFYGTDVFNLWAIITGMIHTTLLILEALAKTSN